MANVRASITRPVDLVVAHSQFENGLSSCPGGLGMKCVNYMWILDKIIVTYFSEISEISEISER